MPYEGSASAARCDVRAPGYMEFMAKEAKKRGAGPASRVRDAISGRFVKKGTEKRRPKTTIIERVRKRK